jgi:hypothetical protein
MVDQLQIAPRSEVQVLVDDPQGDSKIVTHFDDVLQPRRREQRSRQER